MEQYLRAYTNYMQNDWVNWLPMAEFAANNHVSETTKMTPFFANYGHHPRMNFFEPPQADSVGPARFDANNADEFAKQMESLHQTLREEIIWAQARYEQRSQSTPTTAIRVGDEVWLDARNLRTERPSKKLDHKNIGPFKVIQQINPRAFRLELPATMKIHNVFHTSLLHPVTDRPPVDGQAEKREPPPSLKIEREGTETEEWEVQEIADSRMQGKKNKRLQYKVVWKGHKPTWNDWEEVLPGCDELVQEFHHRYPQKHGPPKGYEFQVAPESSDDEAAPG
jgi:hypothetical protein